MHPLPHPLTLTLSSECTAGRGGPGSRCPGTDAQVQCQMGLPGSTDASLSEKGQLDSMSGRKTLLTRLWGCSLLRLWFCVSQRDRLRCTEGLGDLGKCSTWSQVRVLAPWLFSLSFFQCGAWILVWACNWLPDREWGV